MLQELADSGVVVQGVPSGTAARPVLTSYRDAALRKDWHLCWTQLPTIGEGAVPPPFTWSGLGLRSPPIFNVVVQHLQEVSALSLWAPEEAQQTFAAGLWAGPQACAGMPAEQACLLR